jgi:hypothetical protein
LKTIYEEEMTEKSLHNEAVHRIAEERFRLDGLQVRANTDVEGEPDIEAFDQFGTAAIGEVETAETINEESAKKWKEFGSKCVRFYLYVPEGYEEETLRLLDKYEVNCAGVRVYCLNGKLDVKSVPVENLRFQEDKHPWWVKLGGTEHSC